MNAKRLTVLLSMVALLVSSAPASADQTGPTGALVGILVNDISSTEYGFFRGKIVVQEEGAILRTYKWGGSLCPQYFLTAQRIEDLRATVGHRGLSIKPFYRSGNASNRCLVGFVLAEPDVIEGITILLP